MKRAITAGVLLPALLLSLLLPSSAFFWSKKEEPPYLADISKNALMGETITFDKEDWTVQGNKRLGLSSLTVESLPDAGAGTLLLAGTILEARSRVEKSALPGLKVQTKGNAAVTKTSFRLSPEFSDGSKGNSITVELTLLTKANQAPVARNMDLTTYENVSLTGYFDAVDGEGDTMTFRMMSNPARGAVTVAEDGSGQFVYRPYENKTGKDNFTYVAVDAAGNISEKATVTIQIQRGNKTVTYPQLDGHPAHKSAVRLAREGIYIGPQIAGECLFDPDAEVTRSEFLAMAMDVARLKPMENVTRTGFADDEDLPAWSKGMVSAALRAGAIQGWRNEKGAVVFGGEESITAAQAAVMLDSLLQVTDVPLEVFAPVEQAHWAGQAAANLAACGIIREEDVAVDTLSQPMTLGDAALMLDGAMDLMEQR